MNTPEKGASPVRAMRIEDGLWDRVCEYAHFQGISDSDAARRLLSHALAHPPAHGPVQRPPLKWMLTGVRPESSNKGSRKDQEWKEDRANWVLARVPKGSDWWDLDDALRALPGAYPVPGTQSGWVAVPQSSWAALNDTFRDRPSRVQVHSLVAHAG